MYFRFLTLVGLTLLVAASAVAQPYNVRQSAEGYWIGGAPVPEDGPWFAEHHVTTVWGSTYVERAIQNVLAESGAEWERIRFRSRSPETELLLERAKGVDPSEIYLHCEYGADRSGVMLAYLLVAYEGWRPDAAFLAVAYAGGRDEDNLVRLLEENGYVVTDEERAQYAGIYSGATNGGSGGLKVRGEDYVILINNTLDAIETLGVPRDEDGAYTRDDPESYTSQIIARAEAERQAEEAEEAAEGGS